MSLTDTVWHYDYPRLARDSGFSFEGKRTKTSFNNIAHLDIDQVIRDCDVVTIENHIPAVVHFTLDNDQTSILDPNFVKLFYLSQLSVQYLLFCKMYLDKTVVVLKKELQKSIFELKEVKEHTNELQINLDNTRKQTKQSVNDSEIVEVFQCAECPKTFLSQDYLLAHVQRRHRIEPFQAETDKLQSEIKELKERLKNTEKLISNKDEFKQVKTAENIQIATEIQNKFELLKAQIANEFKALQSSNQFDIGKYEKWFETFSKKLSDTLLNGKRNVIHVNGNTQTDLIKFSCQNTQTNTEETKGEKIEKSTQTTFEIEHTENLTEPKDLIKNLSDTEESINDTDIQEKIRNETRNEMQKLEQNLHEKMSSTIGKLENQFQTFLDKVTENDEKRKEFLPNLEYPRIASYNLHETLKNSPKKKRITKKIKEKYSKIHQKPLELNVIEKYQSPADAESSKSSDSINDLEVGPKQEKDLSKMSKKLEEKMHEELETLGISPHWTGLPLKTFHRALSTVKHQSKLLEKSQPTLLRMKKLLGKKLQVELSQKIKDKQKLQENKPKLQGFFTRKLEQQSESSVRKPKSLDSDSDSSELKEKLISPRVRSTYAGVISELKSQIQLKAEDGEEKTLVTKKKVLFDLETNSPKLIKQIGESNTTVNSSVLDSLKVNEKEQVEREKNSDLSSDFDISEILSA